MNIGAEVTIREHAIPNSAIGRMDMRNQALELVKEKFLKELEKNYEFIQEIKKGDDTLYKIELICITHDRFHAIAERIENLSDKHPELGQELKSILNDLYSKV